MACFDLHRIDGGLVVDVQSDLLEPFSTRVVIPLVALKAAPQAPRRLNPVLDVAGSPLILATHLLAALPRAELGAPVGSLALLVPEEQLHALAGRAHALDAVARIMFRAPSCTTGSSAKNSCRRPNGSASSVWSCPGASRGAWS